MDVARRKETIPSINMIHSIAASISYSDIVSLSSGPWMARSFADLSRSFDQTVQPDPEIEHAQYAHDDEQSADDIVASLVESATHESIHSGFQKNVAQHHL
jgi:hypothetical protein